MSGTPTKPEIEQYLRKLHAPVRWAGFLVGLPWGYLRPVVTIAQKTGNHPAVALGTAAAFSTDEAFKAAAARHLERKGNQDDQAARRAGEGGPA